jgi:KaiC/GvpD/RAD55 family RecA-like ATPase
MRNIYKGNDPQYTMKRGKGRDKPVKKKVGKNYSAKVAPAKSKDFKKKDKLLRKDAKSKIKFSKKSKVVKKDDPKSFSLEGKFTHDQIVKMNLTDLEKQGYQKDVFLKTKVPGFDVLIGDGIPHGSAVLVEGGPGSGKTIFCLEIAKKFCEEGKKVLYMSFEEPEFRLVTHLEAFGANPRKYIKEGNLYVKRFNALDIARSVEALLSEAKKELLIDVQPVLIPQDFKPDVVLIDSLSSIASAFSGEENRFRIYMEQLFRYLESNDITSFLIREVSSPSHVGSTFVEGGEAVSFLSDGIIAIYNVFYKGGTRKRGIEVVKMRGTGIERKIVEFDIRKGKGAICYPNKILKGDFILT